jgi:RNA polymerase sigma-70 factor (ECF subfamily)
MGPIGPDILTRLLDQHGAALVLYARQWCPCPEDVVQDAFIQLVRLAERPENVVGWLYRVVRNGAITASRSAERRVRRETAVAQRGESWFVPHEDDRLDAKQAALALKQLPAETREIIVARLWGGLSFDEIAKLTELPTSTVHRWYQQGLADLRERMGGACRTKKTPSKT